MGKATLELEENLWQNECQVLSDVSIWSINDGGIPCRKSIESGYQDGRRTFSHGREEAFPDGKIEG